MGILLEAIKGYVRDPKNAKDWVPWLWGLATTPLSPLAAAAIMTAVGAATIYGAYSLLPDRPLAATALGDPAARERAGTLTQRPAAVDPGAAVTLYYIYVLDISGGSVWIGQEGTRAQTPRCRFAGGGLCTGDRDPPATVMAQSEGYPTVQAATAAWCAAIRGHPRRHVPVAGDSKVDYQGGSYWIGLAPACPA